MDKGASGKDEHTAKMSEHEEKVVREQDPSQQLLQEGQSALAGQGGTKDEKKQLLQEGQSALAGQGGTKDEKASVSVGPDASEPHKKRHGKHHGSHRGEKEAGEHHEEHPHRAMTPLEDEVTYHGELGDIETMTEDPDWRRENMPSVPLSKKDPKHHDVVEEGLIPEALPELGGGEKTAA